MNFLVHLGISNKRIEQGLNEIGLKGGEMDGILITHEHSDHIKGLGVLSRKHHLPIYGTQATLDEIASTASLGAIDRELLHPIFPDVDFSLGDLTIKAFSIDHDAADPVAYRVDWEDKSVAVVTDLGEYQPETLEHLGELDALLLEANHDLRMLQVGPYPYYLKQRILGEKGHLSNELSGQLLSRVLHDRFRKVVLGHLSKENNYPQLAYESVKMEITMADVPYKGSDFPVEVARRDEVSELISF